MRAPLCRMLLALGLAGCAAIDDVFRGGDEASEAAEQAARSGDDPARTRPKVNPGPAQGADEVPDLLHEAIDQGGDARDVACLAIDVADGHVTVTQAQISKPLAVPGSDLSELIRDAEHRQQEERNRLRLEALCAG